ncbi:MULTISPECIES: exodeoxyribonuclease VII small subunit [Priestia]|jgi:exodeoxyribonuclease VII small subunit|uniref:Exodeoxyribonuclease 7 small subunit n=6 Tax=Priestia TaxID=2800373 RepID=D5DS69_PRIM1|nr:MULTISPECIES: exodeoxyribonuclease VII small subunit [Priestia]AVX10345.1 exodeoxyribonuclease VII small subunit [Bacillus sp. Y-01]KOP76432.1 exodeoxyribonuclease VII small subunit [Bacillus sp. FJAT-21351]KQU14630.1 exodeoxyribonuclease VII small subunit [Bacillus sp. Leaf75]KRE05712.1 exodeoxyribonuclease VII small subunit [Bacillus sp. Root239]KRF57735.1 exodeoxyribonuclease VII small subunit [Bacillus sp. Soil531]MBK0007962.1 exodeoxyribonuclease VII small subunit [Bacillus sp. S35]M
MATNKEYTFEEAMEQLETIVNKLEEGDVPLEEAIQQFQEGMTLSKFCHDRLQHIEKQMETILREDGTLEPFSVQEEE